MKLSGQLISTCVAIALAIAAAPALAQAAIQDGTYVGLGRADGMELKLSTLDGIIQGTFTERSGTQSVIRLQQSDDLTAVGTIRVQGVPVFVLLESIGNGQVVMGTVPLDSTGMPIPGGAQGFDFRLNRLGRF